MAAVPGILSTYAASSNREDLAPKPKKPRRKRVAFNWKGREGSSNIEDRRDDDPKIALQLLFQKQVEDYAAQQAQQSQQQSGEDPPIPRRRPKVFNETR